MTTYGLTDTGFVIKPFETIVEDLEAASRTAFALSGNFSTGFLGKLLRVVAEPASEVWDLAQAINAGQDPDGATATLLDAVGALSGTIRLAAQPSLVTLTLTGTPTTVVASGSRVKTLSTGKVFATLASATITAATAWAITTPYVVGDIRKNASRIYVCITAGTSAGSGGPTTTSADITDNTAHWRYCGEGTGTIDVGAASADTGAVIALSGDLTVIDTTISGWSSVINLLDADLGRDIETDPDFRARRELELAQAGASTTDAIRADLLQLAGVISVTVFENQTDLTDGDGMTPHSVEALVRLPVGAANDQLVWDQLRKSVAAGIVTLGTSSGTSTDDEGTVHTIKYSRPSEQAIYVDVTYTYDAVTFPADGESQIKAAIIAYGDAQKCGVNAVASRVGAQAFAVAGVLDIPRSGSLGGCLISLTASPTLDTTIAISLRQLATYDTSRITLHGTPGTP